MATQVQGLQLFNNNEMRAQTAALDNNGPFAGKVYKVFINTPKHHLTDAEGGESNFAGAGYTVQATIIGMDATKAAAAFPQSDAGTDLKVIELAQENGATSEKITVEYKGVQIVKRTVSEGTMALDGSANAVVLPWVSFTFTYANGSYSETGGKSYHLTPNQGA